MPIAVLVLALVAYGYALLAYPEFRRPGLIGGALIAPVLGALLLAAGAGGDPRRQPHRPRASSPRPARRRADGARRHPDRPRPQRLRRFRLRDMTLALRPPRLPRPPTPAGDCPVIGEAQGHRPARRARPARSARFSAHFLFAGVPPVAGTLRWDWRIAATRATD